MNGQITNYNLQTTQDTYDQAMAAQQQSMLQQWRQIQNQVWPIANACVVQYGIGINSVYPEWGTVSSMKKRSKLAADKIFKLVRRCFHKESPELIDIRQRTADAVMRSAADNGQTALHEELARKVATSQIERKLAEAGFTLYIEKRAVETFYGRSEGKVNLTPVKNFGRPIPEEAGAKLRAARETRLFQEFSILHAGAAMIKTTAEKIRQKDPICFGLVEKLPDRLYFICDWVDELCHLTLTELLIDPAFTGSLAMADGTLDEATMQQLTREVEEREKLLAETCLANWQKNEKKAKKLEGHSWRNIFHRK